MKRTERVGALIKILTESPNRIYSLQYFCDLFGAAKSSVSEDIQSASQAIAVTGSGYLETIAGYAYLYNWDLDNSGDWKVGVGYTLSLTQREEYMYIPVPLPLPIASLTYQRLSLQAAYIPGVKNDGNVLFAWLKWTF